MADTKRKQIVAAFNARMKTISIAKGYNTDLGSNIFAWRATGLAKTECPGMIHRDTENDRTERNSLSEQKNKLTIEMEIFPEPGSDTIDDAYDLIQDVFTAIAVDDRWGGLADDTNPGEDKVEIEQHERIIGKITLSIIIEYTSEKWTF
jgi:hypothetical protein